MHSDKKNDARLDRGFGEVITLFSKKNKFFSKNIMDFRKKTKTAIFTSEKNQCLNPSETRVSFDFSAMLKFLDFSVKKSIQF